MPSVNKFDRFQFAAEQSGVVLAVRERFGKYGEFQVDNADVCLWLQMQEEVDPTLIAVTWMNETTFRFYSEPNTNKGDDWKHFDYGPAQLNFGTIAANIDNRFLNVTGIDVQRAFGNVMAPLFDGDPLENLRLASRLLLRIGRAAIIGPNDTTLYTKLTPEEWEAAEESYKNERRCVAYTGPEARPARYQSWLKYGPMFETFFKLYSEA